MLSEEALVEIEARANAATGGPWGPHEMPSLSEGLHEWFEVGPYPDSSVCEVTNDYSNFRANAEFIGHAREDIPALCATVRVLRQRIAELTAEWCECGHVKTQHGFFSDHDECYECDQMSDDLCCHWRPAPRAADTYTALREQLVHRTIELEHESRETQKWSNRANQLAIEGQGLRQQLARVTQERDSLLDAMNVARKEQP